jgi:hypothetical protein
VLVHFCRCSLLAVALVALSFTASHVHAGGRPSESILPNTTKGYLSSPNPAALREAWEKTQLGQLVRDPEMAAFVASFRDQLNHKLSETGKKLGVTWTDLEGVPGGEMALAIVANHKGQPTNVLLADVAGHQDQAAKLMAKIETSLTTQGAKKSEQTIAGVTVNVYALPREEGDRRARQAFHVVKEEMLIACDDAQVLTDLLGRWNGDGKDTLATLDAFKHVMEVATQESKGLAPHARWFIEPFGLVEMLRAAETSTAERKRDVFKALKNQGYMAIKGIGGHLNFSAGGYELLHRTAIYAPAAAAGERFAWPRGRLSFPTAAGISRRPGCREKSPVSPASTSAPPRHSRLRSR